MFDPTVYENLKVVIEGSIYDLDLAGCILVIGRVDRMDMATMSRYYAVSFVEKEAVENTVAEIRLFASIKDLAAELLEDKESSPGCQMEIRFLRKVVNIAMECSQIEEAVSKIWQGRPQVKQTLSFDYGSTPGPYRDDIILDFGRKIDEEQIDDIPDLIDHMLHTVQILNQMK
ncbi:MAG TPA: hypothetical protein VJ824_10545 [Bacillota bacterium]|nr:hypothetical protein [Bacillota bacterium]